MANLLRKQVGKEGRIFHLPVDGGSHIYEGTMVSQLTATGMLVPGATSASGPCIGVATHETNNAGSDGDTRCAVETERVFIFATGLTTDACTEATLIGSPVYMYDDHTVYDNDASGTLKRAGYFMGMEPNGDVRVLIVPTVAPAVAAAPTALTFTAVAGTANTTLEALANPTDTPGTADALRDDLVAVFIPALRNNIADLATAVNAIRTALVNAGLMA